MGPRKPLNAGLLLGVTDLIIVAVYRGSLDVLLAGLLYLMVANFLCFLGMILAAISRRNGTTIYRENASLSDKFRSQMLVLVAWQLTVIGILEISASDISGSHIPFMIDYCLVGWFFLGSYRLVSIADSSNQDGGYIPLSFFGRPRTRRLVFVMYTVFCALLPLIITSIAYSFQETPRPNAFRHPQLCLLMTAITSAMAAGFLFERYHRSVKDGARGTKVLIVTLCLLAFAAVIQTIFAYGIYIYILSGVALISGAYAVFCLWRIGEGTPAKGAKASAY
jgi:hypothetical protein